MAQIVDFDKWDDRVKIRLFNKVYDVRISTFEDAQRMQAIQEEWNKLGDNEIAVKTMEFIVERFTEAGAEFTTEDLMKLAPAKLVAITKVISQGPDEGTRPLPISKD